MEDWQWWIEQEGIQEEEGELSRLGWQREEDEQGSCYSFESVHINIEGSADTRKHIAKELVGQSQEEKNQHSNGLERRRFEPGIEGSWPGSALHS